jgi:hypothetical protein
MPRFNGYCQSGGCDHSPQVSRKCFESLNSFNEILLRVTVAGREYLACGSDKPAWSVSSPAGQLRHSVLPSPSSLPVGRAERVHAPSPPECLSSQVTPAVGLAAVLQLEREGWFQAKESLLAQQSSATPAHFLAKDSLRTLPWSGPEWFRFADPYAAHTCPRSGGR